MVAIEDAAEPATILRTYKFEWHPSTEHEAKLTEMLSHNCRIYNAGLQEWRDAYEWQKKREQTPLGPLAGGVRCQQREENVALPSFASQSAHLTQLRRVGVGADMPALPQHEALRRLWRTIGAFYRRCKEGGVPGYPRFRSWTRYDSITFGLSHGNPPKVGTINACKAGMTNLIYHVKSGDQPVRNNTLILDAGDYLESVKVIDRVSRNDDGSFSLTVTALRHDHAEGASSTTSPTATSGAGQFREGRLQLTSLGWLDNLVGTNKGRPALERNRGSRALRAKGRQIVVVKHGRRGVRKRIVNRSTRGEATHRTRVTSVIRMHRTIPENAMARSATVRRDGDRWFISIACELPKPQIPPSARPEPEVGLDLRWKHSMAVLSTGEVIKGPNVLEAHLPKLARLQRRIDRPRVGLTKKKQITREKEIGRNVDRPKRGSNGQRKNRRHVRQEHGAIARARADHAHKLSRRLVNDFSAIHMEDLDILSMVDRANPKLQELGVPVREATKWRRRLLDQGWRQFADYLAYKAEEAAARVTRDDPDRSSQECSGGPNTDAICGVLVPKELGERIHRCPACGFTADVALNAALNHLKRGQAASVR